MTIFLIMLLIAVGGLAFFIMKQPDEFIVSRSMSTSAAAERIFPLVNDLQQWQGWSPWAKLDPSAKPSYAGPQEGVGAVMRWNGNAKMGAGKMTITESRPNEAVMLRLEFTRPMQATHTCTFRFKHLGTHTEVTWSMRGTNNFIAKAMWLFTGAETMIGTQFQAGLASIKAMVEPGATTGVATLSATTKPPRMADMPATGNSSVVVGSAAPGSGSGGSGF